MVYSHHCGASARARRRLFALSALCGAIVILTTSDRLAAQGAVQAANPALVGAWTLNAELSDKPPAPPEGGRPEQGRGGLGQGPGQGGRRGGGGFGGGFGGGRGGPGGPRGGDGRGNPEDMRRRREAMRDLFEVPDRITITSTETMVIVTSGDGRTTRLSPNGSKIKDESTGIERRTRWEAGTVVSEISGVMGGRVTETYAIQPETGRLEVVVAMQGGDGGRSAGPGGGVPRHRVYDRNP